MVAGVLALGVLSPALTAQQADPAARFTGLEIRATGALLGGGGGALSPRLRSRAVSRLIDAHFDPPRDLSVIVSHHKEHEEVPVDGRFQIDRTAKVGALVGAALGAGGFALGPWRAWGSGRTSPGSRPPTSTG